MTDSADRSELQDHTDWNARVNERAFELLGQLDWDYAPELLTRALAMRLVLQENVPLITREADKLLAAAGEAVDAIVGKSPAI